MIFISEMSVKHSMKHEQISSSSCSSFRFYIKHLMLTKLGPLIINQYNIQLSLFRSSREKKTYKKKSHILSKKMIKMPQA